MPSQHRTLNTSLASCLCSTNTPRPHLFHEYAAPNTQDRSVAACLCSKERSASLTSFMSLAHLLPSGAGDSPSQTGRVPSARAIRRRQAASQPRLPSSAGSRAWVACVAAPRVPGWLRVARRSRRPLMRPVAALAPGLPPCRRRPPESHAGSLSSFRRWLPQQGHGRRPTRVSARAWVRQREAAGR